MQQNRNLIFALLITFLLYVTGVQVYRHFYPPPPPSTSTTPPDTPRKEEPRTSATVRLPAAPPPLREREGELVTLGGQGFEIEARFDPFGAGLRTLKLPKFQAATPRGEPAWDVTEDGKKVPRPLTLVSDEGLAPSHLLYHFEPNDTSKSPLDTLGRVRWQVVKKDGQAVVSDTATVDGQERQRQQVSFQTEVGGIVITKTYSVVERQYHLGLEVALERRATGDPKKDEEAVKFRYQLTGAHGLPVEGKWYTSIFRNTLIATQDGRGNIDRDVQELRQVGLWAGGNKVVKQPDTFLRYAGVAVQFFASVIAVDTDQKDQTFLASARPTLERGLVKGKVRNIITHRPEKGSGWTVASAASFDVAEEGKWEMAFQVRPEDLETQDILAWVSENDPVAVIYHPSSLDPKTGKCPNVVVKLLVGEAARATHAVWEDDMTVRVNTEAVDLKPGEPVVHKYMLYNGPVKVSQLYYAGTERKENPPQVDDSVVQHYLNDLSLNTLTDYHSPGVMGSFLSKIYWTSLVIHCTNLMHWILGMLHSVIPSYGLCIILLTVLVRGLMFPISRRQAMMSIKMQELAPEMKALGEKYKEDPQGRQVAQMELFRKHGVNPLGGCWFMLLQMPIMMGLYYALQESILFRLGGFWPTWITNLAAPDMMIYWTDKIPWISDPESYGGFIYLGPYLNLLPLVAASLMLLQQRMYTPPPADEQQEAQQKMMNFMVIFMGLMFYKVAAGLCVYFIASSLWGFAERRLLPKRKKLGSPELAGAGGMSLAGAGNGLTGSTGISTQSGQRSGPTASLSGKGRGKGRKRKNERAPSGEGNQAQPSAGGMRGWLRSRRDGLRSWWNDILEQARKK